MNPISFQYQFEMPGGKSLSYKVELDRNTLSFIPHTSQKHPEWTKLSTQQCSHCPLKPETHPHCPIAVNIADLVEHFKNEVSHTPTKITVTAEERSYVKEVPLQIGLYSIFGVIMATSGCPVMNFLKPMARFHLPFATPEEAIVRSVSMYLLGQYFESQKTGTGDFSLKSLDEKYKAVEKVNQGMVKRIATILKSGDANQNTVTTLDSLSKLLKMALGKNLEKYAPLFSNG